MGMITAELLFSEKTVFAGMLANCSKKSFFSILAPKTTTRKLKREKQWNKRRRLRCFLGTMERVLT